MRKLEQVGSAEGDRKGACFRSPDHDAQFWRIKPELRGVDAGDLALAQHPLRPRIAQQRQRSLKSRLETRRRIALRDAPAALSARKAPLRRGGCDIDLAYFRGRDDQEPVGGKGRKAWPAPAAREGKHREKRDGGERRGRPGKTAHRRRHHMMPPAKAISPGINSTVTMKMPRVCWPVSVTVGRTSTGGFMVGALSSRASQAMPASTTSELPR